MTVEGLVASLENKVTALEVKKAAAREKGAWSLADVFEEELIETKVTLELVRRALEEIQVYRSGTVRDKLRTYLLEELPRLTFFFKTESINTAVGDALEKAFERLVKEEFEGKAVRLVEGGENG